MIAAGLVRAVARGPLWTRAIGPRALGPILIAGVAAAPVFLAAPALAGSTGPARTVTNCGAGVSAVNIRLAASFDPLTATPAQLTASGLPLRPTGRVQLAAWRKFVTGGVRAARTTCAFAAVTPSSAPRSIVGDAHTVTSQSIVGDVQPVSPNSIVGDAKAATSQSIVGDAQPANSQSIVGDAKPASSNSIVGDAQPAILEFDRRGCEARDLAVDRRRRQPGSRYPDAPGHRAAAQRRG